MFVRVWRCRGGLVDCVALNHAPATFHRTTVGRSGTPRAMGNIAAFDTWGTIFPVCAHISLVGDGMALFCLHSYCYLSLSLLSRSFFAAFPFCFAAPSSASASVLCEKEACRRCKQGAQCTAKHRRSSGIVCIIHTAFLYSTALLLPLSLPLKAS